jgi:putative component of membrane protein insertase Oxa1/YidC/SpoIIIJ protein YidD
LSGPLLAQEVTPASSHRPPEQTQLLKEERQLAAFMANGLIKLYQLVFSDRQGEVCNFTPSCSNYAYQAIKKKGLFGVVMAFDRLERCNYAAWQYKDEYYSVKWVPERGYKLYDPVDGSMHSRKDRR